MHNTSTQAQYDRGYVKKNRLSKTFSVLDNQHSDEWDGVHEYCQALDHLIEVEMDQELFEGKRVLEIGFCTGLPSIFALDHGANSATVYCSVSFFTMKNLKFFKNTYFFVFLI